MARVDWMLACELAYLDRQNRLCVVGVTTHLWLPVLPIQLRQLMLVAHLTDLRPGERFGVGVAVSTPAGQWIGPSTSDGLHVDVAEEYVFATLRDLPLSEEGTYRLAISVDPEPPLIVDVPVLLASARNPAELH